MYYQSRINSISDISESTIEEQIKQLRGMGIGRGVIIGKNLWLNNANPSGCGGSEAAVFFIKDAKYYSFESITIPWCKDDELKAFINDFQNEQDMVDTYHLDFSNPSIINNADSPVFFDCGCCGTGFESTIKEQAQYDQDSGFGICPNCAEEYH